MNTKKKMAKRLSYVMACIMFLTIFTVGIGITQAKEPVTLKVWHVYGGPGAKSIELITERFEEENPDIKIKFTIVPNWTEARKKVLVSYTGGVAPDVITRIKDYWVPEFVQRGMLLDISDYVNEEVLGRTYFEFVSAASVDDRLYGLPIHIYWHSLFYNPDLFWEAGIGGPPDTWEELREFGAKLTRPEKNQWGFLLYKLQRTDPGMAGESYVDWVIQNNSDIWNGDANDPKYDLTAPGAVETLQYLVDCMYKDKAFAPAEISKESLINEGRIAMWWNHGSHIPTFKVTAPDLNYRSTILPKKENRTATAWGNAAAAFSSTEYPTESWKFMEFLVRPENNLEWLKGVGYLPVRQDMWKDIYSTHPAYDSFKRQMLEGQVKLGKLHRGWDPIRSTLARELQYAFWGKKSVKDTLEDAQTKVDEAVREVFSQ